MAGDDHVSAWTPKFILKFLISTAGVYATFLLWGVRQRITTRTPLATAACDVVLAKGGTGFR